jgi:hypothetical protein
VDEALLTRLETAIADAGALVVRVQKYGRGAGPEGQALFREAMALGDRVRRLHRRGRLEAPAARSLLAEADALAGRLRSLLAAIRRAPDYAAALAAHAAGDHDALRRLLPQIFAGLEAADPPPRLYAPIAWRRGSRARGTEEVAAEVVRLRDEGIAAEGDDLSPGADAGLTAVALEAAPPADEPILACFEAAALRLPLCRLVETGLYLAYVPRLRAPLRVILSETAPEDESLPADFARYREDLRAALHARGVSLAPPVHPG